MIERIESLGPFILTPGSDGRFDIETPGSGATSASSGLCRCYFAASCASGQMPFLFPQSSRSTTSAQNGPALIGAFVGGDGTVDTEARPLGSTVSSAASDGCGPPAGRGVVAHAVATAPITTTHRRPTKIERSASARTNNATLRLAPRMARQRRVNVVEHKCGTTTSSPRSEPRCPGARSVLSSAEACQLRRQPDLCSRWIRKMSAVTSNCAPTRCFPGNCPRDTLQGRLGPCCSCRMNREVRDPFRDRVGAGGERGHRARTSVIATPLIVAVLALALVAVAVT